VKLLEDKRFYVYVFLDPMKPGECKYGDYMFEYCPFYVGKGKSNRLRRSLYLYSDNKRNTFKMLKIRKLRKLGHEPIVLKYLNYLTELEAFNCEIEMIKTIGRRDKNLGPLTNLTDGGEGMSGHLVSLETIMKNSGLNHHQYGKSRSEDVKHKISTTLKMNTNHQNKKSLSEKTKQKISVANKGRLSAEKHHMFGRHHSVETIEKIRASKTGKNKGSNNPNSKPVIVKYKYYGSLADAGRDNGISWTVINYRIKKKFPGYKYIEETI